MAGKSHQTTGGFPIYTHPKAQLSQATTHPAVTTVACVVTPEKPRGAVKADEAQALARPAH
jgi:hypothetical protein